jgi:hypothetical protein
MNDLSLNYAIHVSKEDGMFVAHCLELDIVAVADSAERARRECVELIRAQVGYAVANDNLHNLYPS